MHKCLYIIKCRIIHVLVDIPTGGNVNIFRSVNGNKLELGVLAHEASHGLDMTLGTPWDDKGAILPKSSSQEWLDAESKDYDKTRQWGVSDYAIQTIFANGSRAEDFADSIRLYITDKNKFKNDFPARYEILNKLLK